MKAQLANAIRSLAASLSAACILLLACAPDSRAAASASQGAQKDNAAAFKLPAVRKRSTTVRTLRSEEGLDYLLFISAPEGSAPPSGYPVLYVLDGNAWFGVAAEIVRLNEIEYGPALVVGIGYETDTLYDARRRGHDFTKKAPASGDIGAYEGTEFGGADAFLEFLVEDVRAELRKSYPLDDRRQTLFGHSLGGFFALHVLFTKPEAFDAIIAASPAIWWGPQDLLEEEKAFLARVKPKDAPRLLITVGELEQKLGAADERLLRKLYAANPAAYKGKTADEMIEEVRERLRTKNTMVDDARAQSERLKRAGIEHEFVIFAEENHRTSVAPAIGRGMYIALGEP